MTAIITECRPKDELERQDICLGNFVTIDDDSDVVDVYVVKEINESTASIYALELSPERDDIFVREKIIPLDQLIYIGEEFVNVGGFLWKIRESILEGRDIESRLLVLPPVAV